MKHFISMSQLTNEDIVKILETALVFKEEKYTLDEQTFVANLFFEPSTRTKMSFAVAEKKLGMEVLDFNADFSSVQKGESLYDTARTFESIGAQMLVIRHESDTWYEEINANINIPIINGGAGKAEHPTQCMLDLLTIYEEFGHFNGLNVAISGDIKHSRVAKSNAYALKRLGANVFLCAAPGFEDPTMDFPYISIDEAVEMCDALMLLRIQHERHDSFNSSVSNFLVNYGLTKEREQKMQDHAIIMHPAPINRGVEIDSDLVECERSRIFKQMNNGVYVRMSIMVNLLKDWGIIHDDIIKERKAISL